MGGSSAALGPMNAGLYEQLGGAVAVAAVVDDALDRHAVNPALAPLLCGKDLPQLKALGVSVLCARVTASCSTEAAGPTLSDVGLRFSPAELQAVIADLTETLDEQGIVAVAVEEIVNLLYAAREAPPP